MARIKSDDDIKKLRTAGKILAGVLDAVEKAVAPGVKLLELDAIAENTIRASGATPAFLNYQPYGAYRPFPSTLCVAVNDVVVHGIPHETNYVLKEGDIIGIDTGLWYEGVAVDSGRTVAVGAIDEKAQHLLSVTKEALMAGITEAKAGNTTGDIGNAIERHVKGSGLSIIQELAGHGVGHMIHEPPSIPNFGKKGSGAKLIKGMVLAIEPMLNEGSRHVVFLPDGYTVKTKDGKRSAHFEHTILVTSGEPEILTLA